MTLGWSHHYLMLVTVAKALILPLVVGAAAWGELLVLCGELPVSCGGFWWVLGVVSCMILPRSARLAPALELLERHWMNPSQTWVQEASSTVQWEISCPYDVDICSGLWGEILAEWERKTATQNQGVPSGLPSDVYLWPIGVYFFGLSVSTDYFM